MPTLPNMLAREVNKDIRPEDYVEWLESTGSEKCKLVDAAVKEVMGETLFDRFDKPMIDELIRRKLARKNKPKRRDY